MEVLPVAIERVVMTLYFCILVGFMLSMGTPTKRMYNQASAVANVLAPEKDSIPHYDVNVQFRDLNTVDDIYTWISDTFIPSVFVATDFNGNILPEDQRGRVDHFNKVLGGVIFEMTPWEFTSCDDDYYYPGIYGNCTDTESDTENRVTSFLEIGLSPTDAAATIADFKSSGMWVNDFTKQLLVKVVTYNADIGDMGGYFTVTRLQAHFAESGELELGATTVSIPDFKGSLSFYVIFGAGVGCVVAGRFLWKSEKITVQSSLILSTPKQFLWAAIHLCVKFGAILGFVIPWIRITLTDFSATIETITDSMSKGTQGRLDAIDAIIQDLDTAAQWMEALSVLGALAIAQLGLYCIRQLRFHPQLNVFARTVVRALKQFRNFFVVFIIIFLTFAFSGNVLFGHRVHQFSTGYYSMQTCINMLFGEFDYDNINKIRGSGFFFWGYMIVVSLILLNMMLAIVMGTYKEMSKEGYQGEVSVLLMDRLSKLHQNRAALDEKHPSRTKPREDEKVALADFETYELDLRKLDHDAVVKYGKIRPLILRYLLSKKWKKMCDLESGDDSAVAKVLLTPCMLRQLLPAADITDSEMHATFQFLHDGLKVYKAVVKHPETTSTHETNDQTFMGNSNSPSRPSLTPQDIDIQRVALNDLQGEVKVAESQIEDCNVAVEQNHPNTQEHFVPLQSISKLPEEVAALHARVAGIEQKLDQLLQAVLSGR